MAVISGSVSARVATFRTYEWQYYLSGFKWVLQFRATDNEEWEVLVDQDGYDGYVASTPSGFQRNGYENRVPYGSVTGVHTDKFRKQGSWVNA